MVMTTLAHLIDVDLLREAYRRTRKDGAVGVDGQTAAGYAASLESNLQSLLDRFKSGTYRAPPVRRVYIPKGDGTKLRPIGIPTLEDKILQRAGGDGLGGRLRAGLFGLLVWFPTRPVGASGARTTEGRPDEDGWWRSYRARHQELL
ncbi:MAG: hypothetical protein IPK13_10015 [Deltaproteobacteria bacterium]|nr:hypothetical protein [Deltaproteobacteria bacterium]